MRWLFHKVIHLLKWDRLDVTFLEKKNGWTYISVVGRFCSVSWWTDGTIDELTVEKKE